MFNKSDLRLLHRPGHAPGADGFKLTGKAKEGYGSCKVWLRRNEPWERYLDPRVRSEDWDVRYYVHFDSAFSLQTEFTIADLEEISEAYEFTQKPDGLDKLELNGDPVHDAVLEWAWRATGFVKADESSSDGAEADSPSADDHGAAESASTDGDTEGECADAPAAAGEETDAQAPTIDAGLPADDGWGEAEELARRISGDFEAVKADSGD